MAKFRKGESGNPGGIPKIIPEGKIGKGRTVALAVLDEMLARQPDRKLLLRTLEAEERRGRTFQVLVDCCSLAGSKRSSRNTRSSSKSTSVAHKYVHV